MSFDPMKFTFNGVTVSVESDTPVPDTTKDAGPDTIDLHEKVQKPATEAAAEYDASENVDVPEDVEKANENTFFGVILKHRSSEAFAKTKGVFASADAFFKSNECKQAAALAKQWIKKRGGSAASQGDLPDSVKNAGFAMESIGGVPVAYAVKKNKLYADVVYKSKSGEACTKSFATVQIGSASAEAASPAAKAKAKAAAAAKSAPAAKPKAAAKPKTAPAAKPKAGSKVNKVLSKEDDDPVDNAFETEGEPAESPVSIPEPAPEAPPVVSPEPVATPVAEPLEAPIGSDVTSDEIEAEAGAESFLGAVTKILRSREEADAAVSGIEDAEIEDVVGDSEGDSVADIPETGAEPAESPAPEASTEPEDPEDLESKSIEAFLAELNL